MKLNLGQKIVLLMYASGVAGICLFFVPWRSRVGVMVFSPLWAPPSGSTSIAVSVVSLTLIGLSVTAAALIGVLHLASRPTRAQLTISSARAIKAAARVLVSVLILLGIAAVVWFGYNYGTEWMRKREVTSSLLSEFDSSSNRLPAAYADSLIRYREFYSEMDSAGLARMVYGVEVLSYSCDSVAKYMKAKAVLEGEEDALQLRFNGVDLATARTLLLWHRMLRDSRAHGLRLSDLLVFYEKKDRLENTTTESFWELRSVNGVSDSLDVAEAYLDLQDPDKYTRVEEILMWVERRLGIVDPTEQ